MGTSNPPSVSTDRLFWPSVASRRLERADGHRRRSSGEEIDEDAPQEYAVVCGW
ncbi:hypothetical protein ACFQO4_09270 [Saliphagus sp. GCM10025334]